MNWKYTLDISEIWAEAEHEDITAQEFSTKLIEKLSKFSEANALESAFEDEILQLEELVAEEVAPSFDEVDEVLDQIFDEADRLRIWVKRGVYA